MTASDLFSFQFSYPQSNCMNSWNIEVFGLEEKLGYTIKKISHEVSAFSLIYDHIFLVPFLIIRVLGSKYNNWLL